MTAAARRLLAALTLLSVLVGTLGWANLACGMPPAGCDEAGGTVGVGSDQPAGHGTDHRGVPPAGCATVAHCVAPAPAGSAIAPARTVALAEQPHEVRATLPRGPILEPEFPAPRA